MADGVLPDVSVNLAQSLRVALAERDAWAQALFESNRFAAELALARQRLVDDLASADARAFEAARNAAQPQIEAFRQERDRALMARDAAWAERDRALAAAGEAEALLHRTRSSTSWRLTAPMRAALTALRGRAPS